MASRPDSAQSAHRPVTMWPRIPINTAKAHPVTPNTAAKEVQTPRARPQRSLRLKFLSRHRQNSRSVQKEDITPAGLAQTDFELLKHQRFAMYQGYMERTVPPGHVGLELLLTSGQFPLDTLSHIFVPCSQHAPARYAERAQNSTKWICGTCASENGQVRMPALIFLASEQHDVKDGRRIPHVVMDGEAGCNIMSRPRKIDGVCRAGLHAGLDTAPLPLRQPLVSRCKEASMSKPLPPIPATNSVGHPPSCAVSPSIHHVELCKGHKDAADTATSSLVPVIQYNECNPSIQTLQSRVSQRTMSSDTYDIQQHFPTRQALSLPTGTGCSDDVQRKSSISSRDDASSSDQTTELPHDIDMTALLDMVNRALKRRSSFYEFYDTLLDE